MASVLPSRLAAVTRLRCSIFQTAYNPLSVRTGAKYLRARLRGPSMMNYYPEVIAVPNIKKEYPDWEILDLAEQQRLEDVEDRKSRGKGTPRKAKNKGASTSVSPRRRKLSHSFFRRVSQDEAETLGAYSWAAVGLLALRLLFMCRCLSLHAVLLYIVLSSRHQYQSFRGGHSLHIHLVSTLLHNCGPTLMAVLPPHSQNTPWLTMARRNIRVVHP
ncbi:uncharacterized protein PHACADRAFT_257185 [Phanerochaete carnosa HHB-10118-sp]|uniref:Small ribosomal subunit protein mS33 n=1 Tax=Phanerochaete carnosa (strain HHB-10118-sp) TaxID=650164 RepID=K5WA57_PHACS|nr:uncharacterized protein PHACADRAFT_257185 [Phanerochaete carnosa HHB-10118-sp]EKM56110.1 hypothetical protein PHACADRAFT_257185 [Phanerochaete carnosa HHB-10118-sp]